MTSIQEALRRMELQQQAIARSSLAVPLDMNQECKRLSGVAQDFARRASESRVVKAPLDPSQVWQAWTSGPFEVGALDARQIKTLCVSPDMATRPELVGALQRDAGALSRTSCLMGLIFSYFARWGDIRHQDQMESLICGALRGYTRRNPLLLGYRKATALLFKGNAAQALGSLAVDGREAPKACLSRLRIGLSANLAVATLSAAARQFVKGLSTFKTASEAMDKLRYAFDGLLVKELPTADFYALISGLILCNGFESYPSCHDALRQYVLHHGSLGDPRLRSKNWAGMDRAATDKFLKWIAKESIVFFFNHVLPDNSANERRKDFWLDYLGAIKDFQVALSNRHYRQLYAASRLSEVPGFGMVDHDTTSAFIMRFGVSGGEDVIIVEFSETGNAAHAFRAPVFERKAGTLRNIRFEFGRLKHRVNEDRILHLGAWETYARNKLARWGVRR